MLPNRKGELRFARLCAVAVSQTVTGAGVHHVEVRGGTQLPLAKDARFDFVLAPRPLSLLSPNPSNDNDKDNTH